MKVFLDTNVLVSAFATRGLSADLFRTVLAEHEFMTSEVVIEELKRVLSNKFGVPESIVQETEDMLRQFHVQSRTDEKVAIDIRDPDDALVLSSAIAAGAEVLITGDRDLLDAASTNAEIRIIDQRGFWDLLRKG